MVLYTFSSLLDSKTPIIVGLKLRDTLYTIHDLLHKQEAVSILHQYNCVKEIRLVKAPHFYAEIYISEESTADTVIPINLDSGVSMSPDEETVASAFYDFGTGANVEAYADIPYAPLYKLTGEPEALTEYYNSVFNSDASFVVSTPLAEGFGIRAFKYQGNMYTAQDILTSTSICTNLKTFLGHELTLNLSSIRQCVLGYVEISKLTSVLIIPDSEIMNIESILNDSLFQSNGLAVTKIIASNFSHLTGDLEACEKLKLESLVKVITITDEGNEYLLGIQKENCTIGVKDIIQLQYAYDHICTLLGVPHLSLVLGENLTARILAPKSTKNQCQIVKYENMDPYNIQLTALCEQYKSMTEAGILDPEITAEIAIPRPSVYMLTHFPDVKGDIDSIQKYTELCKKLNPVPMLKAQRKPTDKLSRALPSYSQIVAIYNQDSDTTADMDSEAQGSSDNLGETNYFTGNSNDADEILYTDYSQLDMGMTLDYMPLNTIFSYYDSVHYKEAISNMKLNIDPKLIEGNSANNTLGIQENELEFYLSLRNLVLYGICAENKICTLAALEDSLSCGTRSKYVDYFLQDVAEDVYTLNWVHTGHVLAAEDQKETDEDGEVDSLSVSFPGRYNIVPNPDPQGKSKYIRVEDSLADRTEDKSAVSSAILDIQDGLPKINAYAATSVVNPFAWIEIVIRLCRWGERKPTSIYSPTLNGKPKFLNMSSLVISDFSGSFMTFTPNTYGESKAKYTIDSKIVIPITESIDTYEIQSRTGVKLEPNTQLLCGVSLMTTFEEVALAEYMFIDIFTLASQIARSAEDNDYSFEVYGISFDTSTKTFSCSADLEPILAPYQNELTDISYLPENKFEEITPLDAVIRYLDTDSNVFKQTKSAFLAKYLMVIGSKLPNIEATGSNSLKNISIFDILRVLSARIQWDMINDCAALMDDSLSSVDKATLSADIRRKYNTTPDQITKSILLIETVMPFLKLYERLAGRTVTLAEALTEALAVQAESNNIHSNARKVGNTTNVLFSQMLSKCESCYRAINPLDNSVVCYVAQAKSPQGDKTLLWMPNEASAPAGIKTIDVSIVNVYKAYVKPFIPHYSAMAKNPTPDARLRFEKLLEKQILTGSQNTFTSLVAECCKINKQKGTT